MEIKISTKREVKRILFLLSAAIVFAGLLAVFMLYFYGPTGRYLAGDAILAPSVLDQIHLRDKHPQTGQNIRFIFDKTTFSYFDRQKGKNIQHVIFPKDYEQFYQLVSSDKSLEVMQMEGEKRFNQIQPALLITHLRTEVAGALPVTKIFQIIQFTEDDYFRVQLHSGQGDNWAYFYHSGLYQIILSLFNDRMSL